MLSGFRVISVKASCPEPDQTTVSLTNGSVSSHPLHMTSSVWSNQCSSLQQLVSVSLSEHEGLFLPVISQSRSVTSHPVCTPDDITSCHMLGWFEMSPSFMIHEGISCFVGFLSHADISNDDLMRLRFKQQCMMGNTWLNRHERNKACFVFLL